jgi:predicted TIM-barrel fold metal-dependent hydrolase
MGILDVHAHLWTPVIGGKRYMSGDAERKWFRTGFLGGEPVLEADAEKLIESLDRAEDALGTSYRICVFAIDIGRLFPTDLAVSELNDWVAAQAKKDPRGRIIPFACVDPTRGEALDEVRRCLNRLDARGVKLYPPTGFYPDEERLFPFYEGVIRLQERAGRPVPVLFHQGFAFSGSRFAQPVRVEEVAFRFKPDLRIVLAHAGIPWTDEAISLATIHRNVYLDIALFGDLYGFWPELHLQLFGKAKRAGVLERVLFGSDWPLSSAWMPGAASPLEGTHARGATPGAKPPPWAGLQRVVEAIRRLEMPRSLKDLGYPEITRGELEGILGRNARELVE